ncbi:MULTISPECIES: DNA endonuclease SmrA [Dickeya]|uniref:Smr domain-containing protein n=1 Tax=Dickeya aquatica TaxID=1401087 RepID=A0A375ABF6_9GAMM|nr:MULTISPECIES: DNA endonuclease SmrA [Dickeya]SLM63442.1 Small mutS2-related DNA endonuclease, function unknown [Dickeya aquatica]
MLPEEKALFMNEMGDVKPLKPSVTVMHLKPATANAQVHRVPEPEPDNVLITGFLDLFSCDTPLEFKREGVQQGVVDKLRQGKYTLDASLNLLRKPVADCRQLLFTFMRQAQHDSLRNLLIIHGKSSRDNAHNNVVRNYLFRWLQQFDTVQAFCPAQPFHGGSGACYVSLRKSEQAKLENRERHARRCR